MRKGLFSVERIVAVLKQSEFSTSVRGLVCQLRIPGQTFYCSNKLKFGLQPNHAQEWKQAQDESAGWKQQVSEMCLEKEPFCRRLSKKVGRPAPKREMVMYLISFCSIKRRLGCALFRPRHSQRTHRHRAVTNSQLALRRPMREIAQVGVGYGADASMCSCAKREGMGEIKIFDLMKTLRLRR
ncbi:MAG: hypothetical protein LC130_30645 [Bryobacterales bacterium]|nr:hypothetical protein [Bryobacterales bacterium]